MLKLWSWKTLKGDGKGHGESWNFRIFKEYKPCQANWELAILWARNIHHTRKQCPSKRLGNACQNTQLSLKKDKNNKVWAVHGRNFDKQFFHRGKSILPFEWMIFVKQNRRYNGKVFRTLIINISQVTCRCVPKHRSFEVKKITKWEQPAIETLINNHLVKERAIIFTLRMNDEL